MKTLIYLRLLALLMLCISLKSTAQLPDDFVTKVRYHERKTVSYSLVSAEADTCLTLSELSQYHGYMQFYAMDEYVDLDGDLITDQNFIYEQDVRDDWMESYSRILAGKNSTEVYGEDGSLVYSKLRSMDTTDVFLNSNQASAYGTYLFDDDYFDDFIQFLDDEGVIYTNESDVISFKDGNNSFSYDHISKVSSVSAFDTNGLKLSEQVIEYGHIEGDSYFPETDTKIEWFIGRNGCCIRKITVLQRYQWERVINDDNSTRKVVKTIKDALGKEANEDGYEIHTEANEDVFRISSKDSRVKQVEIIVYDLNGKTILHSSVAVNARIRLPQSARAGMYLVHIISKNRHKPVVGKVIKCNTTNSF